MLDVDVALAVGDVGEEERPVGRDRLRLGAGLTDGERVGAELDLDPALLGEAGEGDDEHDDQDHEADDDAAERQGEGPGVAGGALLDGAHEAQRFADGPVRSQSGVPLERLTGRWVDWPVRPTVALDKGAVAWPAVLRSRCPRVDAPGRSKGI